MLARISIKARVAAVAFALIGVTTATEAQASYTLKMGNGSGTLGATAATVQVPVKIAYSAADPHDLGGVQFTLNMTPALPGSAVKFVGVSSNVFGTVDPTTPAVGNFVTSSLKVNTYDGVGVTLPNTSEFQLLNLSFEIQGGLPSSAAGTYSLSLVQATAATFINGDEFSIGSGLLVTPGTLTLTTPSVPEPAAGAATLAVISCVLRRRQQR